MKNLLLPLVTMLFVNASALAAQVDASQSVITWKGSKITGDHHVGQLSTRSSSLKLSGDQITGGQIVFEMNSLTVTDLQGKWKDKFLGHMKSADFFDVANFPTATLTVQSMVDGQLSGQLTIKGVTQPTSFPVRLVDGKYVGKATFDRTKFGITYGSGNFFENLGDKMINDKVEVEFSIALTE